MKTTRKTYTATCRRSGSWWAIDVPELDGVFSQARRLDHVEAMARDAIALMLEIDATSFDVTIEPLPPAPHADLLERVVIERRTATEAAERAAQSTQAAVKVLLADGFTTRDVGELLGISFQRVSQLAGGASMSKPAPTKKEPRRKARQTA